MAQVTRNEAIATLEEGQRMLAPLFAALNDAQAVEPKTIGGGEWSAKDLMGHLAFWEELAIEAIDAWRDGRIPRAEAIFSGDDVDAANAQNFSRTAAQSLDEVRARAAEAHERILALIASLSDDEWASKPAYETGRRRRLAEMLGAVLGAPKRPFGHAFAHEPDLRARVEAVRS